MPWWCPSVTGAGALSLAAVDISPYRKDPLPNCVTFEWQRKVEGYVLLWSIVCRGRLRPTLDGCPRLIPSLSSMQSRNPVGLIWHHSVVRCPASADCLLFPEGIPNEMSFFLCEISIGLLQGLFLLSPYRAWQLYRTENLHPPGRPVPAVVLRTAMKERRMFRLRKIPA